MKRRDFLKTGIGATGAGLIYGSGCAYLAPPEIDKKLVWVCSDIHIGYTDDQLDGEQWFANALSDISTLGPVDYALVLGDIAHYGTPEDFQKYLSLREQSAIAQWYELAGNHDLYSGGITNYCELINPDKSYMVLDGNLVWFLLSDEEVSTEGEIGENTCTWLKKMISQNQDKIIIVCSHQCVYGTVRDSTVSDRHLYPKERIEDILNTLRVDIWLCGHQHFYPYSHEDIFTNDTTTFLNVASMSHAYSSTMSQSFFLEIERGRKEITAYYRSHDLYAFDDKFTVSIPVPFPIKLSSDTEYIKP
jgi:3',5'-cyclic AMP phosphodiesterase CpdA